MQIPTEIISQMMNRTDSRTDTGRKLLINEKSCAVFNKILDESRTVTDNDKTSPAVSCADIPDDEHIGEETQKKPDGNTEVDETLAAGIMGNQNLVIYILEGDMESATDPETVVDSILPDGVSGEEYDITPWTWTQTDMADAKPEATNIASDAQSADMAVKTPAEDNADIAAEMPVVENADVMNEYDGTSGEVTARRPTIRTSDRYEEKEDSSGFSEKGDLSPLENENDTTSVKGPKEKKSPEEDNTARNTQEDAQEPVNSAPLPLAEGIRPERFRADQQMKGTADAPVKRENLFEEMVSRIETLHTESRQAVTIQLKPEVLGKVALEIAMDATGLHIKISAADNDVRGMINGQINALIESLENKGIDVSEVEVAYTGVDNGAFQSSHKEQAQPERQRRSFNVNSIEDSAMYYAALPFDPLEYYLDAEVSSVEYRA